MIKFLLLALALLSGSNSQFIESVNPENGCYTFTVGQGTGCAYLCSLCSTQLDTDNYYFTDNVCTYQTGGCVGNPIAGKQYTCCAAGDEEFKDEL
jgi:hypothetical protein